MKGRLTLEQLNSGITDVNLILSKKYDLFNRRRKDLSLKDEQLRSVYLEQGKDLKGIGSSVYAFSFYNFLVFKLHVIA